MDMLWTIDWREMFVPATSLIEVFLRGTLIYFGLLILLRVFKRQAGAIGLLPPPRRRSRLPHQSGEAAYHTRAAKPPTI